MKNTLFISILASICLAPQVFAYTSAQFFDAAMYGNINMVKRCIETGTDPNIKYNTNDTALMIASNYGHTEITRYLLTKNVNLNEVTRIAGSSALMMAASRGRLEIVRLLVAAGADLNLRNSNGQTAADLATYWDHSEVADYLKKATEKRR